MNLEAIGYIRAQNGRFWVELNPCYRKGLLELAGFSHLQLIWWGHLTDQPAYRKVINCEKPYLNAPDNIGVFATRSPVRPNPVLLSIVQHAGIDPISGTIALGWIDAEPDTPILDIKPYHPCTDRVKQCTVPEWCSDWPQWYEESVSFNWSKVLEY